MAFLRERNAGRMLYAVATLNSYTGKRRVFHSTASVTQDGSTFGCGAEESSLLKYFYTQKGKNTSGISQNKSN